MRFGRWNRLALVATFLAVLVAPLSMMVLMSNDRSHNVDVIYQLCLSEAVDGPADQMALAVGQCNDEMSAGHRRANEEYSWSIWLLLAGGTLAGCAVLYGLIWLIVGTAKWVWRGKGKAGMTAYPTLAEDDAAQIEG